MANGKSKSARSNGRPAAKRPRKRKISKVRVFIAAIIILVGLGLVFAALRNLVPGLLGGASLSGQLAATVNGVPITQLELDEGYDALPAQYQYFMTKEEYLLQMIDQEILRQEALKQGFVVTDEEADANLREFLADNEISHEELEELLRNQSLEYDKVLEISRDQLLIQELYQKEVTDKVNVSDEEAMQYYADNTDIFVRPPSIKIRHILFSVNVDNKTLEDTKAKAEEVLDLVADDRSNFCGLVEEYSDDLRSVPLCGEYTFARGQLPPEFETWADSANEDSVAIVSTEYGSHVIWLIEKNEDETISTFREVKDQIVTTLKTQKERVVFGDYMASLREGAEVVNFVEQAEAANETGVSEMTEGEPAEEAVVEEPVEEVVEVIEPIEEEAAPEIEEVIEEAPMEEPVEEVTNTEVTVLSNDDFMDCLAAKKIRLYGAAWDSSTARQKSLFGSDMARFEYVECANPDDYRQQMEVCELSEIQAYPTWRIDGVNHMGVYTVKQLADLAGCS